MAVLFEYLVGLLLICGGVALMNFSIGVYLMLISLSEDIKHDMVPFDEKAKENDDSKVATEFGELIQFHSEVLQLNDSDHLNGNKKLQIIFLSLYSLANDLSEMGEFIYTVIFSWSLIAMCGSMLLMQIEIVK